VCGVTQYGQVLQPPSAPTVSR